jgi:hypothetical protein
MYTMVLMMAATSGGDVAAFGRGGCHGSSCTGTVVTAPVSSCTGTVVSTGCTGTVPATCHGGSGLFGIRDRFAGFLGGRGCTGSSSCHGTVSSCHGTVITGGCHGTVVGGSCHGSAPVTVAVMGGCVPAVGVVGGPVTTAPVTMPVVGEPKKGEPKKDEPKKDEPKKQD